MKRCLLLIVLTFVGCGGGHLKTPQTFTWKLTVHQTGAEDVTIRAKFVPAPCTVFNGIPMTPDSPQKETCYLALTSTATQGDSFYPADVALMVFPQVYLMYVADSHLGPQALYYSGGTITGDTLLGTWQCHPDTPVCFGAIGTVSGVRE